jgi:mannose-6-phosphate isomerase-like protein (cupin superfamily)
MKEMPPKPDDAQVRAYLLGGLDAEGRQWVEMYAAANVKFKQALEAKRAAMEAATKAASVAPPASLKARLFAQPEIQDDPVGRAAPPYIHSRSQIRDFMPWIADALTQLAASTADFDCIPIASSEDTVTLLAKMCSSIPEETHTLEVERVMLVEGYCDFIIGDQTHHFGPGDRYQIPLHVPHSAHITTPQPCIFIVQRSQA